MPSKSPNPEATAFEAQIQQLLNQLEAMTHEVLGLDQDHFDPDLLGQLIMRRGAAIQQLTQLLNTAINQQSGPAEGVLNPEQRQSVFQRLADLNSKEAEVMARFSAIMQHADEQLQGLSKAKRSLQGYRLPVQGDQQHTRSDHV